MKSVNALLEYMKQHDMDAFFLAKKQNIRYISGYTGDDSYLVITKDHFSFLTHPRYTEQISIECPDYEIVLWKNYGSIGECVAEIAKKEHINSLAFEADTLNYLFYSQLEKNVKATLVPTTNVVETFRSIKTPQEIDALPAKSPVVRLNTSWATSASVLPKKNWLQNFPLIWLWKVLIPSHTATS